MKKSMIKLFMILLTSMASGAAVAATGAYVAGDLGQSSYGYGSSNPVMVRASGGYDFLELLDNQLTIGAEGGYASFGSTSSPAVTVKTTALMAAGVASYKIPRVEGLSGFFKLGVIRADTNSSVSGGHVTTGVFPGIGVMYDLNKDFAVRAEYEDYGNVQTVNSGVNYSLTTLSAGVVYRFR
jgi:Outer membrane protein beta-barrel domain